MFLDRVKKIAGTRKLTPWLKSVGWIANDVTRINAGVVPGSTKLQQLAEADAVSITWLLTGIGQPYLVEHYVTDSSAARRIRELLAPAKRARVVRLLGSQGRWHLVVWRQASADVPEAFVTLVGNLGRMCLDLFHGCATDRFTTEEHVVPLVPFIAIGEGQIGRWDMFDAQIGLFAKSQEIIGEPIREPHAAYLTARDQLHASIEEMSETKAARWLALLNAAD